MIASVLSTRRIGASAALVAALLVAVPFGRAETTPLEALRQAAERAPAMQGHDSEARMRTPEAEVRWRRLFFDPALRETGEAQVACDHRIARRPDLDGGAAAVAILWDRASGRVLVRRWATAEAVDLAGLAAALTADAPAGAEVDALAFRRCP
jgi:hypothetical protein